MDQPVKVVPQERAVRRRAPTLDPRFANARAKSATNPINSATDWSNRERPDTLFEQKCHGYTVDVSSSNSFLPRTTPSEVYQWNRTTGVKKLLTTLPGVGR